MSEVVSVCQTVGRERSKRRANGDFGWRQEEKPEKRAQAHVMLRGQEGQRRSMQLLIVIRARGDGRIHL